MKRNFSYLLLFVLLFTVQEIMGQTMLLPELKRADDSLDSNPEYTYSTVRKVLKKKLLSRKNKILAQLLLSNYFNVAGVADSTEYYCKKLLSQNINKEQRTKTLRILGSIYSRTGRKEEALPILFESLKNAEETNDQEFIAIIKYDLAGLYIHKKEFEKALIYLNECAAIAKNKKTLASVYVNMGNIHFLLNDLDKAEENYNKSLTAFSTLEADKSVQFTTTIQANLGSIASERKDYDKAEAIFKDVIALAESNGLEGPLATYILNLSSVQYEKGAVEESINTLKNALSKAKQISNLEMQKQIFDALIQSYNKLGDYKNVNENLLKSHAIEDSINRLAFNKEIKQLEIQYETQEKEKKIIVLKTISDEQKTVYNQLILKKELDDEKSKNKILSLENDKQRTQNENLALIEEQNRKENQVKRQRLTRQALFAGIVVILISVVILMIVYYQKLRAQIVLNHSQQETSDQKITTLIKDQELQLITTAVENQNLERERIAQQLHDVIGGNLAIIKLKLSYLTDSDSELAPLLQQLNETVEQVRDLSHDLVFQKIKKATFTGVIKNHIHKIETVSKKKIELFVYPEDYINQINEELQVELFKVIQELLTNTLKHANAKKIDIHLNKRDDTINLMFEDDGVGFDPAAIKKGIGFRNIKKRIASLSGTFVIDSSVGKGTIVHINI